MDEVFQKLEADIARCKSELSELESAARVLRRYYSRPDAAPLPETKVGPVVDQEGESERDEIDSDDPDNRGRLGTGDLFGFKIADAAKGVLSKSNGQWLDYRAVAVEAFQRGYRGRDPLQRPEGAAQSFYHTMKRLPEVFESRGPVFKLRESRGTE